MPKAAITKPNKERVVGNLTLRDYFAAKAMAAYIAACDGDVDDEMTAIFSYKAADALLARREEAQNCEHD